MNNCIFNNVLVLYIPIASSISKTVTNEWNIPENSQYILSREKSQGLINYVWKLFAAI